MGHVVESPQRLGHSSAAQVCCCCCWVRLCHCAQHPKFLTTASQWWPPHLVLILPATDPLSHACFILLAQVLCIQTLECLFFSVFTTETMVEARMEAYLCYLSTSNHLELEDLQQSTHRPHLQVPPSGSDQPPVLWVSLSQWEMVLLFPCYLLVNLFKRPDLLSSSLLGPNSLWVVPTMNC